MHSPRLDPNQHVPFGGLGFRPLLNFDHPDAPKPCQRNGLHVLQVAGVVAGSGSRCFAVVFGAAWFVGHSWVWEFWRQRWFRDDFSKLLLNNYFLSACKCIWSKNTRFLIFISFYVWIILPVSYNSYFIRFIWLYSPYYNKLYFIQIPFAS